MHMTFSGWKTFVAWEIAHGHLHREKNAELAELQAKAEGMRLAHKEEKLTRFGAMLGSSSLTVLTRMCLSAWKDISLGKLAELEATRRHEVQVQEMERQRHMADTR